MVTLKICTTAYFDRLKKLPDDIEVYPGHDYGPRPYSTIGLEKKTNYVLEERTLDEFHRIHARIVRTH